MPKGRIDNFSFALWALQRKEIIERAQNACPSLGCLACWLSSLSKRTLCARVNVADANGGLFAVPLSESRTRTIPAATVTLEWRVPSIWTRNSWVSGSSSDPTPSAHINSQRPKRSCTSWRRLQAASCEICTAQICEYCCKLRSNLGHFAKNATKALPSTRKAVPSICTTALFGDVLNPATRGRPTNPTLGYFASDSTVSLLVHATGEYKRVQQTISTSGGRSWPHSGNPSELLCTNVWSWWEIQGFVQIDDGIRPHSVGVFPSGVMLISGVVNAHNQSALAKSDGVILRYRTCRKVFRWPRFKKLCSWPTRRHPYVAWAVLRVSRLHQFRNEVTWNYLVNKGNFSSKYPPRHDSILFYARGKHNYFDKESIRMAPSGATLKRWGKYPVESGAVPFDTLTPGMKKVARKDEKPYLLRGGPQVDDHWNTWTNSLQPLESSQ